MFSDIRLQRFTLVPCDCEFRTAETRCRNIRNGSTSGHDGWSPGPITGSRSPTTLCGTRSACLMEATEDDGCMTILMRCRAFPMESLR